MLHLLIHTDQFSAPPRPIEKPFRCCIADFFKGKVRVYSGADLEIENGVRFLDHSLLIEVKPI